MKKNILRRIPKFIIEKYGLIYRQINNFKILSNNYGQLNSIKCNLPIDSDGHEIPWYTYPSIEYLKQIDFSKKKFFEYGSGYSSLFWAKRVKTLISVENDKEWYKKIVKKILKNQKIVFLKNANDYINSIKKNNNKYDVIIIDGSSRYKCAKKALPLLKRNGFIILDNSDWFQKTAKYLRKNGLIQIDFMGFGPINGYTWITSLFLTRKYNFKPLDKQPRASWGGIKNDGEN